MLLRGSMIIILMVLIGCENGISEPNPNGAGFYTKDSVITAETRGVELTIEFDAARQRFSGTVINTTDRRQTVFLYIEMDSGEKTNREIQLPPYESLPLRIGVGHRQPFDRWKVDFTFFRL